MPTPNLRMPHVHLHALDLAQSTPLGLPARVGVAVEAQLRSSDNSTWRPDAFPDFALSLSLIAACMSMLAVLGTLILFLLVSLTPLSCFLVVSLLLYLSSSDALHSFILLVRCLLSSQPISVCLRHLSYSNVCSHLKARQYSCGMHKPLLLYACQCTARSRASELEPTALGAPAARPVFYYTAVAL